MTLKAEQFEELLTRELSSALEPQRGKALAAFRAQVAEEAQRPVIAGKLTRDAARAKDISRKEMWFWSSVPSIAAACLAVVVTLKVIGPGGSAGNSGNSMAGTIILTPSFKQTDVVSRQNDGILVNNNVAQRVIRENTVHTTEWQDPNDESTYKLIQPGENVNYQRVVPF